MNKYETGVESSLFNCKNLENLHKKYINLA